MTKTRQEKTKRCSQLPEPGSVEDILAELDKLSEAVERLKRTVVEGRAAWYERARAAGLDQ